MDVWIEFRNASKFQAEGLFRNFFPAAEEIDDADMPTPSLFSTSSMSTSTLVPEAPESLPTPAATPPADDVPKSLKDTLPSLESASALGSNPLDAARLSELAKIFADSIPEEEFSVAELQGCESLRPFGYPYIC
jgi:mitochondrial chaperone BCS1